MLCNLLFFNRLLSLTILIVFLASCHKSSPTTVTKTPTIKAFGTFLVSLIQGDDNYTLISGQINDGPSPATEIFEKIESIGMCRLLKRSLPFCDPQCIAGISICVEGDSCQPFPNAIDVGPVNVIGFKKTNMNAKTPFSMKFIAGNYQSPTMALPPCLEGDTAIFTFTGTGNVPACTLTARSIKPLKLLTDSFPCADHQSINVKWEQPTISGISTISIVVDISYHGGNFGYIECDCEDNGSLTIEAALLDKLKSWGIAGFPRIQVYRRSTGADATGQIRIVIESKVERFLSIPGIISCDKDAQCIPYGFQTCGADQRCH